MKNTNAIVEDRLWEECKFRATPTLVLIAANVAMYVYTSLLSGNFVTTNVDVLAFYGQWNLAVFNGYYWQLVSAMFVHFDIIHIASNMIFLFIFGLRAEELFSTVEYYAIYLFSGFAGNLLTLLMGPNLLSAGASGAIFGVLAADIVFLRGGDSRAIVVSLMFAFMFLLLTASEGTNLLAHLGGLLMGLLLGYVFSGSRKFMMRKSKYAY